MAQSRKQPKRQSPRAADRKLRENIARIYVSSEVKGEIQVETMQMIFDWIKTGKSPGKPNLKVVAGSGTQ